MVLVTVVPILLVSRLASKAMAWVIPRTLSLTLTDVFLRQRVTYVYAHAWATRVHLMCSPLLAVLLVLYRPTRVRVPRTAVLLCLNSGTSIAVVLSRDVGTDLLPALLPLLVALSSSTITAESDGTDLRCLPVERLGTKASIEAVLRLPAPLDGVRDRRALVGMNVLAVLPMTLPAPWIGRELAMLKLLAVLKLLAELLTLIVLIRCLLAALELPRRVVVPW